MVPLSVEAEKLHILPFVSRKHTEVMVWFKLKYRSLKTRITDGITYHSQFNHLRARSE